MNSNRDDFAPFPNAVSIESWISTFDKHGWATVHAEVSFGTERVGGSDDAEISFRVSIKRAEVIVLVPATEPLAVEPSSVAREGGVLTLKRNLVREVQATDTVESNLSGAVEFDSKERKLRGSGKVGASRTGKKQTTNKTRTELEDSAGPIGWRWVRTQNGEYVWLVWPKASDILLGRPWNGATEPRMRIEAQDGAYRSYLPVSVLVEVRCLYEDVDIQDIRLKEVGVMEWLRGQAGHAARRAAAEAFIRNKIFEGLRENPLSPYVSMTFARARCQRE